MLKKRDRLLESLKNHQKLPILQFLQEQDLHSLSLANKKYYMQLLPYIKLKQLDDGKQSDSSQKQKQTIKTKNKKKNNKVQNGVVTPIVIETQVIIQKLSLSKWSKLKTTQIQDWKRIQTLPYENAYLLKKLQSKNYTFYENTKTNEILFVNRSIVDPNLNFDKGAFNDQLQLDHIYQHMYQNQGQQMIVDITSRETLLKRQKQMLDKMKKKIDQNQQKQVISYQKQLKKASTMKRYAIILCFGGSFSIAIYQGSKSLMHKSDKKYVCRKKAGQRQLNKDKASGSSIKSMGSQIRRDQQKKHMINVNQILNQYRQDLFKCEIIFLQAPGINRLYIINQNQTMALLQNKLRSVCLTAKKANYTQVQVLNQAINQVNVVRIKQINGK